MKKYITRAQQNRIVEEIRDKVEKNGVVGNFGMPDDTSYKDKETNTLFILPTGRLGERYTKIAKDYLELSKKEKCKIVSEFNGCPYELSPEMKEYQAIDAIETSMDLARDLSKEENDINDSNKKISVLRARLARKVDALIGTNIKKKELPQGMKKMEEKLSNFLFKRMHNSQDK